MTTNYPRSSLTEKALYSPNPESFLLGIIVDPRIRNHVQETNNNYYSSISISVDQICHVRVLFLRSIK